MKYIRNLTAFLLSLSLALVALAKIGKEFQMQLGNASSATADASNHKNYLIERAQYAMDYSDGLGIPNWVSWNLTIGDVGSSGRSAFAIDTTLPSGFHLVGTGDYSGSGYDRGHMCPSADRTIDAANNRPLFYMSNMVPQRPDNNQGIWANFETYCRTLASQGYELLITTGPAGYTKYGSLTTGVAIPDNVWKIVVLVPVAAAGDSSTALERITADTQVLAIMVPNINGIRSKPWSDYQVKVSAIETATSLQFFTALPANIASALRAKGDSGVTSGGGTGGGTTLPLPSFGTQPLTQSALLGSDVTFSVSATSASGTVTYQWFKDGLEINNATGQSLLLSKVTNDSAGSYSVTLTNASGSTTSDAAVLTISTQVVTGSAVVWNFGTNASPSSTAITGLTVSAFTQNNNNGTTTAVTTVSPTVNASSGVAAYAGASGTGNLGAAARIGALNTGTGGSTYFEVTLSASNNHYVTLSGINFGERSTGTGPTAMGIFSNRDGYTSPILTLAVPNTSTWKYYPNPLAAPLRIAPGSSVTLRIYGYNGSGNASLNTAIWRLDDIKFDVDVSTLTPVITTQPHDAAASIGGIATFEVVATSPGTLSYQWRKNGQAISSTGAGGNVSAATAQLTLSSLSTGDIANYDCVVTSTFAAATPITATQTSASASLSLTQSYDAWATAAALPADRSAQTADADGDGAPNLVEYALGLNPLVPDSQLLPSCELNGEMAALRFSRPTTSEGFEYIVETSTDLLTWQQIGAAPLAAASTPSSETLVAEVPATAARRFFRLVLGSVRTVPVAYTRHTLAAAATTAFAPVLDDVQSPLSGIRSGFVDTLTATTLGNTSGGWTGNLANPAAPWALRLSSGPAAGRLFDVKANTATTITVAGVDLTTLGLVAGVDRFELIPLETLGTLFGSSTLQGGATSASADIVQLRSGATWLSYYYDTTLGFWRRTVGAAVNCNNNVVRPGSGLLVLRRSGTLNLTLTGRVLASPFRASVAKAAGTVISQGFPTDTTLAGLSLQNLLPGWRTGISDQLCLHNGSAWIGYYYNGVNWVRSSDALVSDTLPLPGTALLLLQRAGTTAGTVELLRNSSF